MPANLPFVFCNYKSLLGTVTRSNAWHTLENSGHVEKRYSISKQDSPDAERLSSEFAGIKRSGWKEETDMYPDIIEAMKTLYSSQPSVNVVDTSSTIST
jgi:hypothetical protein